MKKKTKNILKRLFVLAVIAGFFGTGTLLLWASTLKIPDLGSFEKRKVEQSTKIYDRTGEHLLFDLHENIQRTVIPFDDMSRHIKNATVAIEDAEFYEHKGIKPQAILRAILVNVGSFGFSQGGSTITQQVVKNSILTSEKKISRKIKEWALAIKIERVLSKERILELYLNESPYGGNLYGIEEASQAFFGKSAADLTLPESAYLAALPQAPTYYSPYGNQRDKLEERKNLVLAKMYEGGFITEQEYSDAKEAVVEFKPQQDIGIQAPHFVFFVQEYLENTYGKRAVEERGFRVITTLDYELQKKAEEIVNTFALENVEKFNAENASLVAIDPKTGQVLVMVGSRNYFDEDIDGNFNVSLAHRQPGSAFKPFAYATALMKGYTPETTVFDLKTQFSTSCEIDDLTSEDNCYSPGNYDNVFRGPVTFREALAQSINVPSVKVLYLAGLSDTLRLAKDMGIKSLTNINQYGLTLVLGGGEVSLFDITSAYGVFANTGMRNEPTGILRIEDGEGVIVEEWQARPVRVLDENIALRVSDMLSDNEARAPAFGTASPLYFPERDVAAKTGTTNDFRDAWIIGYTPSIAVGAWAGNNDNSPMEKKVAGFTVAPLWHAFMQEALLSVPDENFRKPREENTDNLKPVLKGFWQGGESFVIDKNSGKLATEYTPEESKEERVVTNVHSILYWVDKDNPRGDFPEKPERDPQFAFWEFPINEWKATRGIVEENLEDIVPKFSDDVHKPEYAPRITITNPISNIAYDQNNRIIITISNKSRFPLARVDYFLNGRFIGSTQASPYSFSFLPSETEGVAEKNTLTAIGYDNVANKGEVSVTFLVKPETI